MLKNYAIGTTLLALLFSMGTSAQSPKPQPSKAELRAQWQPTLTLAHEDYDYRGGGGDDCAAANPLTVGTSCAPVTFNASGATQSQAAIPCNGFTSPAANDLWFSFQATTPNTTITVTGLGDYDAVIEYFSGSCGSLTSLGCIDETFPPASTVETGTIGTTVGQTYYIRVYDYNSPLPTNFQFTICLVGAGGGGSTPPNDLCTGAVPQNLSAGSTVTFTGNNTGATLLAGTTFVVVWEAFTTTECTNLTVNYCVPGSVFDPQGFLINLASVCPDVLTGLVTGTNTACEVTFTQLPAGTWYIPVLVDAASTPVGAYTISASAVACPPGYCAASAGLCDEYIARVQFGTIDNTSGCADGPSVDYTAISTTVVPGNTLPITVTNGPDFYSGDQVVAWIDWNQNESFLDAGEAYTLTSANAGQSFTGNISVPLGALPGSTLMRIRMMWTGTPSPCGTSAYGEVEDYTVNITGGVVCDADAGTLSGGTIVCLENDAATMTATADGNSNVPAGYSTVYVLTEGAGLVILQAGATPEFTVAAEGDYTIHTLVYDPNTLDLGIVEFGVTTGFDVNGLLIQGGGEICASLDVAGTAFSVLDCTGLCLADAGTLSGGGNACLVDDAATLIATADGNSFVPGGYSTVYVLTEGAGLVIVQAGATPEFTVDAEGDYTIHTLVYDENTLDLGIVEFGVTTGFDVNGLLIQGGGSICASLDVAGAAFSVVVCGSYCDAGADGTGLGLEERIVNVTFAGINNNSPNTSPVAPAYSDFTSVVGNVVIGQSYPIAVDVNRNAAPTGWAENQVLVWIDLNQNGSFQDAGELVFTSAVGALDIYQGNVTIPAGASLGATRMRVRLHDVHDGADYINNFNDTPCGLASYGEVEDYTVVIDFTSGVDEQANNGFSIFPNPGDGNLNVLYGGVSGRASMEVFDMTGRILHSDVRQLNNGEHSTLSLSGRLATGTYILRLTNEQGSMEQRFIVQ